MRNAFVFTAVMGLFGAATFAWQAAPQPKPASESARLTEEVLQAVRSDLQGGRADVIAKNVTLTSTQAAQFWPVFEKYQKEQNAIMDEQLRGIQRYIETAETIDDAGALGLMNAHFDRDARMNALRQKWLADFQKVLGTRLAVRVMQIDRRLSLAHQLYFAARIPLSH